MTKQEMAMTLVQRYPNTSVQFWMRETNAVVQLNYDKALAVPLGLCADRDDHAPHTHHSKTLGTFWCTADQTTRLPFAAEARRKQTRDDLQDHSS